MCCFYATFNESLIDSTITAHINISMLKKNVYIIYPAGYYGTYINWAICMSDIDMSKETVLNPINGEESDTHGGVGTSHGHIKVPTHQGPMYHFMWVMHNKPAEYKIYNISKGNDSAMPTEKFIAIILNSDPDAIFINIHDNNQADITEFGNINGLIKWPTQLAIKQMYGHFGDDESLNQIDPFNCANDIHFRNSVAENKEVFFRKQSPINFMNLIRAMKNNEQWYNIRHSMQPHEINEETYINPATYIANDEYASRIFELSCVDVVSDSFPEFLTSFLTQTETCSAFDTSYVSSFHKTFIESQPNLQWFVSIKNWRENKVIDDFIRSHCGIQGVVLHEMLQQYPQLQQVNWKEMTLDEINDYLN
jgi:hypothetical protein